MPILKKCIPVLVVLLLVVSCFTPYPPPTNEPNGNTIENNEPDNSTPVAEDSGTVYITETGSKYHLSSCRYLRSSKIQITLSSAKSQGYTPCSVCDPPR